MRGKWFYILGFFVLLIIIVAVAVLAVKVFGKKSEPVEVQTTGPAITAPATTATTAPKEQSTTATQTQAQTQQTQPGNSEEADEAIMAAKASAKASYPSVGQLNVLAVKIVDGWARVDMQPIDKSTDAASWFMKKTGGTWVVVDSGTSVMPSDHPDAPAELFK